VLPVVAVMSVAVRSPASVSRTASVTSAPAPASARAVSIPMPERTAGNDRALAREVDAVDHLGRGRGKAEAGLDESGGNSVYRTRNLGHGTGLRAQTTALPCCPVTPITAIIFLLLDNIVLNGVND
jgi:hypothetical protein